MQSKEKGRVVRFEGLARKGGIRSLVSQVPEQIKEYLSHADGGGAALPAGSRHERILWSAFEETSVFGARRLCLVLVYVAGFQIWDVTDASQVAELISVRDVKADIVRFIPKPRNLPSDASLSGVWPALAIGFSASHHRSEVRVFSLVSLSTIQVVTHSSEITQLLCNDTVIVVGCTAEVFVYCSSTLRLLSRARCFAHVRPCSPFALGSQFLAFGGSTKLPSAMENQLSLADFAADALVASRRVAADLWDFGRQKVADLVAPSEVNAEIARQRKAAAEQESFPEVDADDICAGTVVVKDLESGRVVAHFRAHRHAISTLAFDGAGWLLLTSSVEGHNVNVFRLNLSGGRGRVARPTHMYKLRRGYTSALIYNALFSHDTLWIAASSVKGTTHVYSLSGASPGRVVQSASSEYQRGAASRIRDIRSASASPRREEEAPVEQHSRVALPAVAFAGEFDQKARLMVCSSSGTVMEHEVISHATISGDAAASSAVSVEGIRAVNLRRDVDWEPFSVAVSPPSRRAHKMNGRRSQMNPFEAVEMTSSVDKGPLWALNQFVFLSFERASDEIPIVSSGSQRRRAFDDPYCDTAQFAVLELRRSEPLPLSSSAVRLEPVVSGFDPPGTAPFSDEEIKAQMDEALSTQFEIPWLTRDYPNLATEMDGEGPAVIDTTEEADVHS